MISPCLLRVTRALLFTALLTGFAIQPVRAEAPKPATATAVVPVALYDGGGVGGNGPKMLEEVFHAGTEFRITRLKGEDIRAGKLKDFKVLIVPGGSGSKEANALEEEGREKIRQFVSDGGTYVGICAGCYLASCHYTWSLHILPVKVVDTPNWARGRANLSMEWTPDGKEWLARKDTEAKTLYHNGPVLQPLPDAKEKLIPLATFREEITRKGAKEGLMVNTPAIAAARYGKGWAVGISPHPEQTDGLKDIVPAALRWTRSSSSVK